VLAHGADGSHHGDPAMLQLCGPELAETLFIALLRKAEGVKVTEGRHGSQLRRWIEGGRRGRRFDGRGINGYRGGCTPGA